MSVLLATEIPCILLFLNRSRNSQNSPKRMHPQLSQLFRDISLKFSPAESEDIVQSSKRFYGEQFSSLENQDLMSCLGLLQKLGYVSNTKLTLIKEFVAPKSNNENDINDAIEKFRASCPPQVEPEKVLQGRSDDIRKITERLETGIRPVVNLHGSAGVGKTTIAKEVCAKWRGESYVFDLREAKDMRAIYLNIMNTLELTVPVGYVSLGYVVERIYAKFDQKHEDTPVLFLLDNVEQFTVGQGKEGRNLKTVFMQFLGKLSECDGKGKTRTLHILLTSRTQLNNEENVLDYELEPLKDSSSEKILLSDEGTDLDAEQKRKLLDVCKGIPLLLKGTEAILRQKRKSSGDLIAELETLLSSMGKVVTPVKSKSEEDTKETEKPFDVKEEGVDKEQILVIKEMFDTLPSDSLKISAVLISLFCGPFSASTAAEVLGTSVPETFAQLEGLVTSEIINVVNLEAKELMYDIHPLLRKYADGIKNDAMYSDAYTKAKARFYEHFTSKMKPIARIVDSDYVKAFQMFALDRPNFEFTVDISLLPEYFSVPSDFHESALIASLYNAMLSGEKQMELFHSWAEMCKDDGKSGMYTGLYFSLTTKLIYSTSVS